MKFQEKQQKQKLAAGRLAPTHSTLKIEEKKWTSKAGTKKKRGSDGAAKQTKKKHNMKGKGSGRIRRGRGKVKS